MVRGFSILELLITLTVLAITMAFAAPAYERFSQHYQMQSLASELQVFLQQAKSEAVFRNQNLWVHLMMDSNPSTSGQWQLVLKDSDAVSAGQTLLVLDGQAFRRLRMAHNYATDKVKFDGVRGKVINGSFYFSPLNDRNRILTLHTSFGAGRIIVCAQQEAMYGYPQCR